MFEKNFDKKQYQELTQLVENYENNVSGFYDEKTLERIIGFYEDNNQVKKALTTAGDAINQHPFSSIFLVKKAQLFFDLKQFDQALDLLEKAMVLDAQDLQIYLLRSDIHVWLGQNQMAIDAILEALQVFSESEEKADLYLELADIYEEWEKYDKVFEALTATLHYDVENDEALNRIWFCVELSENYLKSIEFHKAFIDENPYSYLAWFNLAHAYVGIGEKEEAVDAFEFVMAINEDYEYAYKDCADVLLSMEQFDKAISYYRRAMVHAKPYKELYIKLGDCYNAKDNYQKARYYYRKASNLDPFYDVAYNKLGLTYMAEDRSEIAIQFLEKACDLMKDNADYLSDLAIAYKKEEAYEEADTYFDMAVKAESPTSPATWMEWVVAKIEAFDFDEALNLISRAEKSYTEVQPELEMGKFLVLYMSGQKQSAYLKLQDIVQFGAANISELSDFINYYPELADDNSIWSIIDEFSHLN